MDSTRLSVTEQRPAIQSILWACISSWYYGYHLSELNYPAESLTCLPRAHSPPSKLPLCIGIDSDRYGFVTAIYTGGGLVGSSISSWMVEHYGVKGGLTWTAYLNSFGAIVMTMATRWWILAFGRSLAGVSSGIAICLVPPFLSSIARASPQLSTRSGQVGTSHQMAIVIGSFTAQAAGMIFTGAKGDIEGNWRYVTASSGLVSFVQIGFASSIYSPPASDDKAARVSRRDAEDGSSPVPEGDEGSPLLPEARDGHHVENQLTLRESLSNSSMRGPTLLCAAILALQQSCGVNAVMFYSAPVLKPSLPSLAGAIGIGITFINASMTVVAIFLVDRSGRKPLSLASIGGMTVMSALLACGSNNGVSWSSATAIISFIVAYSVGLGPIPFSLVSETVPAPGIPASASLALSLSWISAFSIAISFLKSRDALSTPIDPRDPLSDRKGEGRVFYVFTGMCSLTASLVSRGSRQKN